MRKIKDLILTAFLLIEKKRVKKKQVTLIANNCIAGVIYKDFSLQFCSPTVDLYFFHDCYAKFISNLDYYLSKKLEPEKSSRYGNFNYPIARLNDIEIHFMHYTSFQEAEDAWERRCARINKNEIRIIDIAREGWKDEHLKIFESVGFDKVLLHKKDLKKSDVININIYEKKSEVGEMIGDGKIWYYYFDVPHFINTGKVRKRYILANFIKLMTKLAHTISFLKTKFK